MGLSVLALEKIVGSTLYDWNYWTKNCIKKFVVHRIKKQRKKCFSSTVGQVRNIYSTDIIPCNMHISQL